MNLHKGEQHFVKYIVFYLSFAPQGIILEIMCQILYALMYIHDSTTPLSPQTPSLDIKRTGNKEVCGRANFNPSLLSVQYPRDQNKRYQIRIKRAQIANYLLSFKPPPSLFLCEGGRYPTQLCKKGGGECFVTQPTDQLRGEVAQCKLTASYLPMLTGHLVLIRTSDCAHLAIHL